MTPLRMGVLGVARIATQRIIPALQAARGATCVALASRRPGEARAVADRLGIAGAFDSYEALLASPDVEAVYIPVANGEHRRWTEAAAAAGKHVLCEKPLGLTRAEVAAMFAAADRHGVRLVEAYSSILQPQRQRLQDLLAEGVVGRPTHLRSHFTYVAPGEPAPGHRNVRLDPQAGGAGALMDIGCYCIQTARRVFAAEPLGVVAHSQLTAEGVDLATVMILQFSEGRTAVCDVHFGLHPAGEISVAGEAGRITLPQGYAAGNLDQLPIHIATAAGERTEYTPRLDVPLHMVERFAAFVRDPAATPVISRAESLGIAAVIDAVRASARSGGSYTPVAAPGGGA